MALKRQTGSRFRPSPALAIAVVALSAIGLHTASRSTIAHEGHEHPTNVAAFQAGSPPQRLANGTVFIPKSTQRLLEIRTMAVQSAELPVSLELTGRLVADPNAAIRISADRDGRIEAAERGLPHLGQKLAQGDIIAHLVPTLSSYEDSLLRQKLTEIERELALLLPRSEHLGVVNPNMPMGDSTVQLLQEMQIQAQALTRQAELVKAALGKRIAIEAPIAGTVSDVQLARGQNVTRGQTLVELVDRSKARVEAFGFGAMSADIADATAIADGGRTLKLAYLGRGPVLRQQAVALLFTTTSGAEHVEFGLPLRVYVTSTQTRRGMRLPRNAVQRGTGGGHLVWQHDEAETFMPRRVTSSALDADNVLVVGDIADGMRIVVNGAQFIGHIR